MEDVRTGRLTPFGLKIVNPDAHAPAVIDAVEPGSVAAAAGLEPGQRVTSVLVKLHSDKDYLQFPGVAPQGGAWCKPQGPLPIKPKEPATVEDVQFALETAQHLGDEIAVYTSDSTVPKTWTVTEPLSKTRPIHPAQLYAALDALLLCLLLLAFYPYRRRDGEVFALMLTIHPLSRFLQEIIRVDEASVFGTGLSISQNLSILMLVGAIGLWCYLWRQPTGSAWPPKTAYAN